MKYVISLILLFTISSAAIAEKALTASDAWEIANALDKQISMTGNYGLKWENGKPQQQDHVALVRASTSMIFATQQFMEAWSLDRLANRDLPASDKSELDKYSTCAFASFELSKYILAFASEPSFADIEDLTYNRFIDNIQKCRDALSLPIE